MRIGILGSGLMGGKLGTLFARAGHEVVFSYARSDSRSSLVSSRTETGQSPEVIYRFERFRPRTNE